MGDTVHDRAATCFQADRDDCDDGWDRTSRSHRRRGRSFHLPSPYSSNDETVLYNCFHGAYGATIGLQRFAMTSANAANALLTDGGKTEAEEALTSFGDALRSAARGIHESEGDAQVSAAFVLGWQMAELYRPQQHTRKDNDASDLPGLSSLGEPERVEILVDQIQVQISRLAEAVKNAGLPPIELGLLRASARESNQIRQQAVLKLHEALLGTLTAADFRLGKAYGLGRALCDTCRKPKSEDELKEELDGYRVANLRGWLDDLSTAFPPHAAHSVEASLGRWVEHARKSRSLGDAVRALRRQGNLWRSLLSGEKRGTEMLEIENYLDAARSLTAKLRSLVLGVLWRYLGVVLVAVALLGGGIAAVYFGGPTHIAAGAASILVAVGVSWRGVGAAVGQLTGKLEQPLYDALLDAAITDAITLLEDKKREHRGRRTLALQMAPDEKSSATQTTQPRT